jgi:alkylation response protein AidB-like acyl-CoA dehydrogenase
MHIPKQYSLTEELERALGDPCDPRSDFSFARAVALDESEEYPERACALLDAWGLPDFYVPAAWGGRLDSYEQLLALIRSVTRRDFTVGFAYSIISLLGSSVVWAGGSEGQRRAATRLLKERGLISLAYNEKAHGSDFLSTGLTATRVEGGYRLSGEKWLIGNAVRCAALTTVARTKDGGGPRGFSLFFVEKSRLDADSYECLPRIKTLGVRGAHVSGIRFKGSFVGDDALVGGEGAALEQTLKAFQLTRTLLPALSLGAADTALNVTLDFARARRLYGAPVAELPHARRRLTDSFIRLLMAECMAVASARALHQTPEQMRLYSAAAKFFVATEVESIIEGLATVLGARHYLREGHADGIFQKLLRDVLVVRYHFNSSLNLITIGAHLRDLARERQRPSQDRERMRERVSAICDLSRPLSPLDPSLLSIYARGRDDLLHSLDPALDELRALRPASQAEGEIMELLSAQVSQLLEARACADRSQREAEQRLGGAYGQSPEMFAQAERYCLLLAAACALHLWLDNREASGGFFATGEWLALALGRTLRRLGVRKGVEPPVGYGQRVWEQMMRLHDARRLLSIVPLQLARPDAQEPDVAGVGAGLVASEVGWS